MKFLQPEEYQKEASSVFEILKSKITKSLSRAQIEHIGSSAIQGALSKGDLDIYVGVESDDFTDSYQTLKKLGFLEKEDTYRSEYLCMFESFGFDIDVGIHLVDITSKHVNFLHFRDALINDSNLLERYNKLKMDSSGMNHDDYREVKTEFILEVLEHLK